MGYRMLVSETAGEGEESWMNCMSILASLFLKALSRTIRALNRFSPLLALCQ